MLQGHVFERGIFEVAHQANEAGQGADVAAAIEQLALQRGGVEILGLYANQHRPAQSKNRENGR